LLVSSGAAATIERLPGTVLAQQPPPRPVLETSADTSGVPNNEKKINIAALRNLEAEAQKVMAPLGFAYVSGGAGDEFSNRQACRFRSFQRSMPHAKHGNAAGNVDLLELSRWRLRNARSDDGEE
jgi:hypothetical protein